MIFNTHTHLNSDQLYPNYKYFLQNAIDSKVTYFMVVGYDLESSLKAIEIANSSDGVYAAVGIHPSELKSMKDDDLLKIEELLKNEKVKAGATGQENRQYQLVSVFFFLPEHHFHG